MKDRIVRIVITGHMTLVALHALVARGMRGRETAATLVTIPTMASQIASLAPSAPVYLIGLSKPAASQVLLGLGRGTWVQPHVGQPGNGLHILPWLINPIFAVPESYLKITGGGFTPPDEIITLGAAIHREVHVGASTGRRPGGGLASVGPAGGAKREEWAFRWIREFEEAGIHRPAAVSIVAYLAIESGWGEAEKEHNPGNIKPYSNKVPYYEINVDGKPVRFAKYKDDPTFVRAFLATVKGHKETYDLLINHPESESWYNTMGWYSSEGEIRSALPTYRTNRTRLLAMLQ